MEREINISEVLDLVIRRWWIIVLCVAVTSAVTYFCSAFLIAPVYTSSGSLYVRSVEEVVDSNVEISEINASKTLVNTYIEILRSARFTNIIAEDVDLGYSAGAIRGMLSMNALNHTEILQIKVNCNVPEHAQKIVNSILTHADEEILRIVKAGSVEVIDVGNLPKVPTSPNIFLNTVSGAIIGAVISMLIIMMIHIMDVSVRGEEDLVEKYEIPVLGVVPTIKAEGK